MLALCRKYRRFMASEHLSLFRSLDFLLACARALLLALLLCASLPLLFCNDIPSFSRTGDLVPSCMSCAHDLMITGLLEIVFLLARTLIISDPRCHFALALSCSHAVMPASSQSAAITYVQLDAPSLSRFPFLDSTGFRRGANPS